jgi:hypothetical protein
LSLRRQGVSRNSLQFPFALAACLFLGSCTLTGCGETPAAKTEATPKADSQQVGNSQGNAAKGKAKVKYKNEAPNADLGPRERRALKKKGELPQ